MSGNDLIFQSVLQSAVSFSLKAVLILTFSFHLANSFSAKSRSLKHSKHVQIKHLWQNTSYGKNIQHDQYMNTKAVFKEIKSQHEDKLKNQLASQGTKISFLLENSLKHFNSLWSIAQSSLPKNIFNFSIRYLNNTLATRNNLFKWNL